jgi:large subunit ribosomal protein L24
MKLRKGDLVKVIAGKDRGKQGKIEKVFPSLRRVLIPGVNIYKKHVRPQGEKKPGGIIDVVKPLPVANVALLCPKCKKQTRVGFQIGKNTGKREKYRICRKCQEVI